VALGWLDPYIVGYYWLEVANDIFNGVGHALSCPLVMPPSVSNIVPCCWVALHYSNTRWVVSSAVAACPHVLQALVAVSAHMFCRPMMALMSGALKMCVRALGTSEPCRTGRPARLFFVLETHGPQGVVERVGARSPPRREVGSRAIEHVEHRSPPSEFIATVHVVAPELFSPRRRVPELLDTRQPRSPPRLAGRIRSYRIRGGARLHAPHFVLT
jgi:hypothetical protein